ncbi:MAG: 5'-nucleotidase C-terminal domain-containing protein [Gemmatimonadetes bacterium]|nr:5'-nucleotidase C-terminal domain-containing protein [Gemmatimonadota bacterium]
MTGPALGAHQMARGLGLALSATTVLAVFSCGRSRGNADQLPEGAAATPPACAQIFSTNDLHGQLLASEQPWSEGRLVGGSAVMAGYVRQAALEDPDCPVFVVSGGDMMQGTLLSNFTGGEATIAAMNAVGYDVAALGNHEWDWGEEVLRERMRQAEFPVLGANVFVKGTDRHPEWLDPWTIVEKDGVRVGFVGATTTSTPTSALPSMVAAYDFRSIAGALDRYIPEVRAAGADFVVAVMHEGAFCNADACSGEALQELSAVTERFDYAVTGHTHSRLMTEVKTPHGPVPVVQAWANSTAFGLGEIRRAAGGDVSAGTSEIVQTYADEIAADSAVAAVVAEYAATVEEIAARVVTELEASLPKPRRGGFAIGRIIADAQRALTGADIAITNNGGIRRPLGAGPVTFRDLFELQPFGNTMQILDVSGETLLRTLEQGIREDGLDLQISGVEVVYDQAAARGSRIISAAGPDGLEVEPTRMYRMAVNNFLAEGGSGYTALLDAANVERLDLVDLDALIAYLQQQPRPLPIPSEPRWTDIGGP